MHAFRKYINKTNSLALIKKINFNYKNKNKQEKYKLNLYNIEKIFLKKVHCYIVHKIVKLVINSLSFFN